MRNHVAILGAGISGLSAGWHLSEKGIKVDILESCQSVGGLAGTFREGQYCMDFGPHSFFSENQQLINKVLGLFDHKLQPQPRRVKFYYKGKFLDYPLTPRSVIFQMGIDSGIKAAFSLLKGKLFSKKILSVKNEDESVEDWAITNFGEHLYQTFFKPYTEQFWKIPCSELSSRTIPTHTRISFMNTLRLLLHKKSNSSEGSLIEREMLPTYYPNTGFVEIAERIGKVIKKKQGHIHLRCKVSRISKLPNGKMRVLYQHNGQSKRIDCDYIISTIPIPILIKILIPSPPQEVLVAADKLDYLSLMVLGVLTQKQNILNCAYSYLMNRAFNRISEMNEFSPYTSPPGENILTLEIPCLRESAIWKSSKEELFDVCINDLVKEGFLRSDEVKRLFIAKAPYAFPIYHKGYAANLEQILNYLRRYTSLSVLGRCGEFMYMDTDECMKRAFDSADNCISRLKN